MNKIVYKVYVNKVLSCNKRVNREDDHQRHYYRKHWVPDL